MALPRLPPLEEIWRDPSRAAHLPAHVLEALFEQFKRIESVVASSTSIPPTPVEMALRYPRYSWMNTKHIHFLGDAVAVAVDRHGAIIVTMPPRHAKTHTCSIWTPFWFLARNPEAHVLFISYEANFARKWGIKVRGLVEMYGREFGLEVDPKKTAGDDWELTTGGGMKTVGALGGISGNPVQLLIADDLIKNDAEARSQLQRDNLWDWWEGTAVQRIEPDTTVIVIGTRYHEDDLLGRMIQHSRDGDGVVFEEISLRAKAEEDDPLGREIGEGLWLDHPLPGGGTWGQDFYDAREAGTSPYTWSAVYQQRPSPPGGNMVDPAWWRFYLPHELPSSFDQELQTWDLSLDAEKKTDSYHAGGVMSRRGALIYLRDGFHEHCQAPKVITQIRRWSVLYPGAQYKLVERSLAGPWLTQTLHHEVPGLIPWPPKGRQKSSKEAALNATVPTIRSGNVLLPLNADGSKPRWVVEFIEELRAFPRAPHDDYVDMFTQGATFLLPDLWRSIDSDYAAAKGVVPHEDPEAAHVAALHGLLKRLAKPKIDAMKRQADRSNRAVIPFGRVSTGVFQKQGRVTRGMW